MKAAILFTGSGPLAVLTEHPSLEDPALLDELHRKGVDKFMAFELPVDTARGLYGHHFVRVMQDNKQTDGLRILDDDGGRIFKIVRFADLGPGILYENHGRSIAQDPAAMI